MYSSCFSSLILITIVARFSTSFVCYESNVVNVNINLCLIDSNSTIHIANYLQGMQNPRKPVGSEISIISGNKMGSHVEAIGNAR